jgi:hypothetical protein
VFFPFQALQVLTPISGFSGHQLASAVTSGTTPIQPHGCGSTNAGRHKDIY